MVLKIRFRTKNLTAAPRGQATRRFKNLSESNSERANVPNLIVLPGYSWSYTMLKRLIVLSVFIVGTVAVAHATSISGSFAVNGNTGFDPSTITFGTAAVGGIPDGTFLGMTDRKSVV